MVPIGFFSVPGVDGPPHITTTQHYADHSPNEHEGEMLEAAFQTSQLVTERADLQAASVFCGVLRITTRVCGGWPGRWAAARMKADHGSAREAAMLRCGRFQGTSVVVLGVVVTALAGAAPAGATFPGRDGVIVYSAYLRTEEDFPPYMTTEEFSIKSADYQGEHTTTLRGCTKTVDVIDVGDCGIRITFMDPTVAPSGRRIVFDSGEALAVMTMRGTALRARAPKSPDDGEPAISPTGRRIAFSAGTSVRYPSPTRGIWVSSFAGYHPRRIVARGTGPDWSIRNVIAFLRPDGVYQVRPDGHGLRRLVARRGCTSVSWSPHGTKLALACGGKLLVARADGSHLRRVGSARSPFPDPVDQVVWSPSGTRFAVGLLGEGGGVVTLRTDGTDVHSVAGGGNGATYAYSSGSPDWQPLR